MACCREVMTCVFFRHKCDNSTTLALEIRKNVPVYNEEHTVSRVFSFVSVFCMSAFFYILFFNDESLPPASSAF